MRTNFGFHDLHSFKDFVGFVRLCAPDEFPVHDWLKPEEQWTLDMAFDGLRHGLAITAQEKGELPMLETCRALVEKAYAHYKQGQVREGFFTLKEMESLLKKLPSQ